MAKTDYITSGNVRLMVYQSDIINASSADPYVQVSVYFQVSSAYSGKDMNFLGVNAWSASMVSGAYTASGNEEHFGSSTWSGWKTVKTIFYQKGVWSANKTRTSFDVSFTANDFSVSGVGRLTFTLSGTVSMQAWGATGTKDTASIPSSMTMGSAASISITHKTTGNKNTLTWKFGSQSGTILSNSTATSASFTPATSLGAQIPSAMSGTISFTLTTYNSSGSLLGSTTYTSVLNVPAYTLTTPTISAAKVTYTTVDAFVANKTKTRFTLSGLPAGSCGATVTGAYVIRLSSVQQTSGTKTGTSSSDVDYTPSAAGTLTLTYTITDSRGKTASAGLSRNYVANKAPTISFSAARDANTPTTWVGSVSGTYLNVTGNTPTVTYSAGTASAPTASDGSYSGGSVTGTLAETSSLTVKATVTDTLGNTASKTVIVPTVFAYIEATPSKVIAIGRKASSASERVEIGLPTYVDGDISQVYGGVERTKLNSAGLTINGSNGSELAHYTSNGVSTSNSVGVERMSLTDAGLVFRNASGTETAKYTPLTTTAITAANASLTMSTKSITVYDFGKHGIIYVNLNITSGFNAGTSYQLAVIDRSLVGSFAMQVPNTVGNSSALVSISGTGSVEIYRYSGSGAFTGWLRAAIPVVFA